MSPPRDDPQINLDACHPIIDDGFFQTAISKPAGQPRRNDAGSKYNSSYNVSITLSVCLCVNICMYWNTHPSRRGSGQSVSTYTNTDTPPLRAIQGVRLAPAAAWRRSWHHGLAPGLVNVVIDGRCSRCWRLLTNYLARLCRKSQADVQFGWAIGWSEGGKSWGWCHWEPSCRRPNLPRYVSIYATTYRANFVFYLLWRQSAAIACLLCAIGNTRALFVCNSPPGNWSDEEG